MTFGNFNELAVKIHFTQHSNHACFFMPLGPSTGCMNSLDWTTGLDYWTGLLDSLKMWFYTILRADRGQGHFKGYQEAQPHGAC